MILKFSYIYNVLIIDSILDEGLNNCGRGVNVVVIDNMTRSILRVSNFDTYLKGIINCYYLNKFDYL